jgi:hypothetical protein
MLLKKKKVHEWETIFKVMDPLTGLYLYVTCKLKDLILLPLDDGNLYNIYKN